jgi:pyruvate dehydrogenase E2 component (dihydrolipoamide acetyltransferase)
MIASGKLASMKLLIAVKRTSLRIVYHNNNRLISSINYPTHIVVNMPSLSPTMEVGTIGKWLCQVGDEIKAGSAMAEIETDKASMTFEAQDEFYIAKLLCDEGQEIKVGQPILITVDDKSLVSSFSSFTLSNTTSSSSSAETSVTPKKTETVAPSTTQPPSLIPQSVQSIPITTTTVPVALTKATKSEPVSVPTKLPIPTVPPTPMKEVKKAATTDSSSSSKASKPSPLLAKFRKDQLSYIEKYGRSCHRVIQ